MSVAIGVNLWTCDDCWTTVETFDSGFPPGWIFVAENRTVTHRCPDCAGRVPPKQRGHPQERAENTRART